MINFTAVESIFLSALDKLGRQEREAFLNSACGADPELRKEVERMLAAQLKIGSFLSEPAPALAATVDQQPTNERLGTVIGPYKLMEQIGEGGFGLVFVAEQQHPVRRKVALKLIKPGMDSRDVIARFEAERQALALMEHPNIARVFDAGATESGRPYFVMELVKGIPIVEYCDQQNLTARERLDLFLSVCQAVQHAHGKGIIHRDLKPSNILVAPYDGDPVVKVIDFGIAKAIGLQLTDKTIYTCFTQMIGTPLYMSPEQAEMNALDVDIRSDVYSLGVLLYELLTGTTPFDRKRFATAALDEIRRVIREEEPPKPSTRLSTMGASLSKVSSQRKAEPAKLSALMRGDLDWMVMKALEKDRARRYETASAFAADVRRFLNNEPVEARPPSALYQFQKLARRNKVALTTGALVGMALIVGTAVSLWQAVRATAAVTVAVTERDEKEKARQAEAKQRDDAQAAKEQLRRALYDIEMSLLQPAWDADNLARFDQLLQHQRRANGDADLRSFEWHYWNRLRHADLRTVALTDGFPLGTQPVLDPDGTRVAGVAVKNGRAVVCVWDTATGNVVQTLMEGLDFRSQLPMAPLRLAFSPDGRRVAVSVLVLKRAVDLNLLMGVADPSGTRREVHVWDAASGKKLLDVGLAAFPSPYDSLAFSPDGQRLAFTSQSPTDRQQPGRINVWDIDRGKELPAFLSSSTPTALAFSPDGRSLAATMAAVTIFGGLTGTASSSRGHTLQVWATDTWEELVKFNDPGQRLPKGIAFSPDGKRLAVVWAGPNEQKDMSLYGADMAHELLTIPGVTGSRPVFSPDGRRITCDAAGSLVHIWDTRSGAVLLTVRGHEKTPAVSFDTTGNRLWTAGQDGTVKEWGVSPPEPGLEGIVAKNAVSPMAYAFRKTDTRLARAFKEADEATLTVRIWDDDHGKDRILAEAKNDRPVARVQDLVFSDDGRRLAATLLLQANATKPIASLLKVWDADSGKELFSPEPASSYPTFITCSPDGRRIAWARDKRVAAWDIATGNKLIDVEENSPLLMQLAFSPDSSRLAWASSDRGVRVWDVAAAREVLVVSDPGGLVGPLVFSSDGKRLAACIGDVRSFTEVTVWDAATGRQSISIKGESELRDLAFSPDGRLLATLSSGPGRNEVKVWDALSGVSLIRCPCIRSEGYPCRVLKFHPDGTRLFLMKTDPSSTGTSGFCQVLDATPLPD